MDFLGYTSNSVDHLVQIVQEVCTQPVEADGMVFDPAMGDSFLKEITEKGQLCTNPLTLEWIDRADGNLLTARREYRDRKSPNFDAVCFHTQQAAEQIYSFIQNKPGL